MDDYQFQSLFRELNSINEHLQRMNGRMGEAEQEIAVLKDRSDRSERVGGVYGAIGGGLAAGAVLAAKAIASLWGKP